jgi:hypothetical protein
MEKKSTYCVVITDMHGMPYLMFSLQLIVRIRNLLLTATITKAGLELRMAVEAKIAAKITI